MSYVVEITESLNGIKINVEDENNKKVGSLRLPLGGQNKYTGAFLSKEIEVYQNSISMLPNTSYVHNIYIEKRECGNVYRSNKREGAITLIPCNKLYLEDSLYYGYEIFTPTKEIVIPVYKNKEGENKRCEEYQVGRIKIIENKSFHKIYEIIYKPGHEMANLLMLLYSYMLYMNKYESDYRIVTDNKLLKKDEPEFVKQYS